MAVVEDRTVRDPITEQTKTTQVVTGTKGQPYKSRTQTVLRIYTDFNARTPDGICWILKYRDIDLEKQAQHLHLTKGDKVILYPEEEDFEVIADLDFKHVDVLGHEIWVAVPDWSTLVRK
jgi:hypothetical protein